MILEFLKKPKNTGSVIPSSRYLVNEMVSHVIAGGPVIELGAGTGVITKKLSTIDGIDVIYSYENNVRFHDQLKKIDKTVCYADLFSMKDMHQNQKVKTVISSIPFVNFSDENRLNALDEISTVLEEGGVLIQYTYLNKCPFGQSALDNVNLHLEKSSRVWFNFPPATVFVYKKGKSNN